MARGERRAVPLTLRIARRHVAFVDVGLGDPRVVEEDLPLGREAAREVELHARGVPLARQQLLRGRGIRVGVALVVLLAVEGRDAEQRALAEQVPLAADLEVAAFFWRRVGREFGARVERGRELVAVARGVVRGAEGHVVGGRVAGLVQRAHARTPQVVAALAGARTRGVAVGSREAVVAQAADQFDGGRDGIRVLHVQADVTRIEGVERHLAARVGAHGAVVGCAHGGVGRRGQARGEVVVAPGVFLVEVHAGQQLVFAEAAGVVARELGQVADADACFRRPAQDRAVRDGSVYRRLPRAAATADEWRQAGRRADGVGRLQPDHAGQQVALIPATAEPGREFGLVVETVDLRQGQVGCARVEVIIGQAVIVPGRQRLLQMPVLDQPRMVVERPAVIAQMVEPHRVFVAGADAPAVGGRDADLLLLRPPVPGVVHHRVDAQGRVLAGMDVEVTRQALEVARADGVVHLVLGHQERLLAHLVDHAARGALAEQHGGRALEHLDAVVVEGVALVERAVAHPVGVDVACLAQREAAQAHVFLPGLAGLEGDAGGGLEHLAEVVEVAVVDQALRHHRDRLRNVAQFLVALADLRAGGAQVVLRLRHLDLFLDDHGTQGLAAVGLRGLGQGTHAASEEHGAQGQQA